jgi:tRNA (guanine-N7-)-methyltransferase
MGRFRRYRVKVVRLIGATDPDNDRSYPAMQHIRHPARIRTFHPRRGRLSGRHRDALERLWPAYGIEIPEGEPHAVPPRGAAPARMEIDLAALFGRAAPVVLEIGSGMGDATAQMAAADPGRDYLAVEVHTPGIAHLLSLVEASGLTNVRVARGDALDLVAALPPACLDAIHVFFPDPWPKARHHKRRLIQPPRLALLRERLAPGGTLHCATDWAGYAQTALAALEAEPTLVNAYDGFAPRPAHRPVTKFEQRGVQAGREVFDLVFRRTEPLARTCAR